MKVNEIMSRQVVTLKPDSSVASAARLMRRKSLPAPAARQSLRKRGSCRAIRFLAPLRRAFVW